jgi:ribosomal peptide maturation radical SAM protein 1
MAYRSKSPDRVLGEVADARGRYGVRVINMVDDILDMTYFRSVLPRLAASGMDVEFFWEIKANLTHDQVRVLRDAGVMSVQPGIESFSDRVLKLMRKGTTAFRNIELLKWCKEYGIKPYWNLLYGFPGETAEDYESTAALIEAIWHLDPPTGYGPIRIDRFSPYHTDPMGFGLVNLRPMAPFTYIYPFKPQRLADIAYYFEFDYADGRRDDAFATSAIIKVREWMADRARGMLSIERDADGDLILIDTRRAANEVPTRAKLSGWKAAVFFACDRAQPLSSLARLPATLGARIDEEEIKAFLDRCTAHKFMVSSGASWLNVAVHVPERANREALGHPSSETSLVPTTETQRGAGQLLNSMTEASAALP